MSKKITYTILGLLFCATPLFASADTLSDQMDQMRFDLFRSAAAQAGFDSGKSACVVKTSATSVRVHETFILAWGAWGSQDSDVAKNTWAPTGAAQIVLDKPGTYKYEFTFYDSGGVKALCQALVSVK